MGVCECVLSMWAGQFCNYINMLIEFATYHCHYKVNVFENGIKCECVCVRA